MTILKPPEATWPNQQPNLTATHRILLFELDYRGHHAGYLQHLVTAWLGQDSPGQLDILVSSQFVEKHAQIVRLADQSENVRFLTLDPLEQQALVDSAALERSFRGRIRRAFQEWRLLQKYTRLLNSTHCFILYLDTLLLRFAFGGDLPCRFSGIYFRPVFHYSQFPNYRPTRQERLWQWRDRICLARLLRRPNLHRLFCLDPIAVEALNRFTPRTAQRAAQRTAQVLYLPDPVRVTAQPEIDAVALRQSLGILPNRQVFLLFGALSERKGLYQLLEAIEQLPPALSEQLCFLLIGPISEAQLLHDWVARIRQAQPVQIICRHEFVSDQNIQPYFQLADVVLAPYQRHIGMSAILVRAAAAQTPVLAADFGLMGEITRRHRLGRTVDSTDPVQLAAAIREAVETGAAADLAQMSQFAAQNSVEQFTQTIFQQILALPV